MITLDLSILNQKGTPMFYSDITANRPAAGIAGRIFIATDSPYGLFRDTGSAWEQVAGSGGGGVNTIYTANDTLTGNRTVSDGGFGLSFTSTTYIGTAAIGSGSGKLIVGSSSADNGIQIFGANSPSLRLDNAQSGGTQRFVFGLATATNNFIQGATAGEFCISTQSAGNMLFGMWQTTNASEVMRITTANNLLVGSSVDNGQKLQINGTSLITGIALFSNNVGIGVSPATIGNYKVLNIQGNSTSNGGLIQLQNSDNSVQVYWFSTGTSSTLKTLTNHELILGTNNTDHLFIKTNGNFLVGTSVDTGQKLQLNGSFRINGQTSGTAGGSSGQHLIINCDGTTYKIALLNN